MKINMFGENNFYAISGSNVGIILLLLACLVCISNVWSQVTHTFMDHIKDEVKSITHQIDDE